jgi:peptidoglycan/xylan/chitin deacetylase (PgdA/CDA1 family)
MSLNHMVYQISRPLGGLSVARYLARWHPRILMYHRISAPGSTSGVNADMLRQHMAMIKKSFNVMTLNALMEANDSGCIPENAVVVTFDDGYHDFADYAFPILRDMDVPATLFVTTGFVSEELWLWPDQIRYALERTFVPTVDLPDISGTLNILEEAEQCWHKIADYCMAIPNTQKLQLIEMLFQSLDVEKPKKAPEPYRALTWQQIREMMEEGLEVGSHSHSHPILTQLGSSQLLEELIVSRDVIEKQLNFSAPAFCYPNGQNIDFNEKVQAAVREAGYQYAVAAFPGANPLNDRWAINRYPASSSKMTLEKILFGLTYLKL